MPSKTTTYLQLCTESTQLWRCAWIYVRSVCHSLTYCDVEDHVVFKSWSLSPDKITTLFKMWGCKISFAKNPSCLGYYVALLGECSNVLTEHSVSIFKQSLSPSPFLIPSPTQTNKQTNKHIHTHIHTYCMHMLVMLVIVTSVKHFNCY